VTVPVATNALVAAALAIIRGGVRLLRRGGHPRQLSSPLRHTPSQLVSLILLLSWAS
jgi:hypothetical protein